MESEVLELGRLLADPGMNGPKDREATAAYLGQSTDDRRPAGGVVGVFGAMDRCKGVTVGSHAVSGQDFFCFLAYLFTKQNDSVVHHVAGANHPLANSF